jgi:hypothetical protein
MHQTFVDIPDVLSINGDRLLIRKYFEDFTNRKPKTHLQVINENNLKHNNASGLMNRKIRMKMKVIIANWIEALKNSPTAPNGHKLYQPTFITLTLPTAQMHTDKELHQKALNHFNTQIRRTHKVENYIWRAERQKNGNLHYHIIIDKFISHHLVRTYWNRILNSLGYIEKYRQEQQTFHINGFTARPELFEKWSEAKQLKAYNEGLQSKWSNPNSTDIHSLKSINNVSDYCTKYISKSDDLDQLNRLEKDYSNSIICEEDYLHRKEKLQAALHNQKINGRLWGCSDGLKEVKDPKLIVGSEEAFFIEKCENDAKSKVICDVNFKVIYCKNLLLYLKNYRSVLSQVQQHYKDTFYKLYPTHKPPPPVAIKSFIHQQPYDEISTLFARTRQIVLF